MIRFYRRTARGGYSYGLGTLMAATLGVAAIAGVMLVVAWHAWLVLLLTGTLVYVGCRWLAQRP